MPDEIKALNEEIKKYQDTVEKQVADIQTEVTGQKEAGVTQTAEQKAIIDKITEDMTKNLEKVTDLGSKLEASETARKELELAISKMPAKGATEEEVKFMFGKPELKEAFFGVIKTQGQGQFLSKEHTSEVYSELIEKFMPHMSSDQKELAVKAMSVGSDVDGGFLCPVDMTGRIIERMFETSPMRQFASTVTTTKKSFQLPLDDHDITVGWRGEYDSVAETSTPKFGKIEIETHEGYAYPKITLQALEDADINLETYLAGKVDRRLGRNENEAFVTGTGISKPKGFLAYDDWAALAYTRNALLQVESEQTVAAGGITGNDLIDLQTELLEEYMTNAKFFMNRKIFANLAKIKDSNGQYLLNPKLLFEGYKPQLLGSAVAMMGDMPDTELSGAKAVAFGDMKETYLIVDRLGIMMIPDGITDPGWKKYFFRKRVGGGVVNFDSMKILVNQ